MANVRPRAVGLPQPSERQIPRNDFLDLNDALATGTRFAAQTLDVNTAAENLKAEIERNPDVKADNQAKVDNAANSVEVLKNRREAVQLQLVNEDLRRKHDVLSDLQDFDATALMGDQNTTDLNVIDYLTQTHSLDKRVREGLASWSGSRAGSEDYDIGLALKQDFREDAKNAGKKFDWPEFVNKQLKERARQSQSGNLPPLWTKAYQNKLLALSTANSRSEANAIMKARDKVIRGRTQDELYEVVASAAKGEATVDDVREVSLRLAQVNGYLDPDDPEQALQIIAYEKAAWLFVADQIMASSTDVAGPLSLAQSFIFNASPEVQEAIGQRFADAATAWDLRLKNKDVESRADHAQTMISNADTDLHSQAALELVKRLPKGSKERTQLMAKWEKNDARIQKRDGLVNEISAVMGDRPFPTTGEFTRARRSSPTAEEERDAVNEWVRQNHLDSTARNGNPLTLKQAVIKLVSAGYPMGDIAVEKLTAAITDPFQIDDGYLWAADVMEGIADATSMNTAIGVMQGLGDNGSMLEGFVRTTRRLGDGMKGVHAVALKDALIREGRDDEQDNRATARRKIRGTFDEATGKNIDKPAVMGSVMIDALQGILESMTPGGEVVPDGFPIDETATIIDFEYNGDFVEAWQKVAEFHYFTSSYGNEEDRLRNAVEFATRTVIHEWSGQIIDGELRIIPRVMGVGPLAGANPGAVQELPGQDAAPRSSRSINPKGAGVLSQPTATLAPPPKKTFAGRFYEQSPAHWSAAKGIIGPLAQLDTRRSIHTNYVPEHFGENAKNPSAGVQMIYDGSTSAGYIVWDKTGEGQMTVYVDEKYPVPGFVADNIRIKAVPRALVRNMEIQVSRKHGKEYRLGEGLDRTKDFPSRSVQGADGILGPRVDLYGKFERAAFKLFTAEFRRPPNQTGDQLIIDGLIERMAKHHGWDSVSDPPLGHGGDMSDEHPQYSARPRIIGGPGSIGGPILETPGNVGARTTGNRPGTGVGPGRTPSTHRTLPAPPPQPVQTPQPADRRAPQ